MNFMKTSLVVCMLSGMVTSQTGHASFITGEACKNFFRDAKNDTIVALCSSIPFLIFFAYQKGRNDASKLYVKDAKVILKQMKDFENELRNFTYAQVKNLDNFTDDLNNQLSGLLEDLRHANNSQNTETKYLANNTEDPNKYPANISCGNGSSARNDD